MDNLSSKQEQILQFICNFIEEIEIYSGGTSLARYSGEYLNCLKERDYSKTKKELWNRMTGNIPQFNDPGNANGNINTFESPSPPQPPCLPVEQLWLPWQRHGAQFQPSRRLRTFLKRRAAWVATTYSAASKDPLYTGCLPNKPLR